MAPPIEVAYFSSNLNPIEVFRVSKSCVLVFPISLIKFDVVVDIELKCCKKLSNVLSIERIFLQLPEISAIL